MIQNNPNTGITLKKRKLRDYENPLQSLWENIQSLDEQFAGYRDTTIEKWSNKIQMSAGSLSQKTFKVVNQVSICKFGDELSYH